MADLSPFTQPRVPSLPALVEALPPHPASTQIATFTRERQVVFLQALAATGAVRLAAASAGVSHQTAYRARLADAVFARGWSAAVLAARVHAEEVLSCRAIDGVEEQVWYHGEIVATRRRFDSRLLLAHLARLDRLTGDAQVQAFAGDFEAALDRFGEGSDTPEDDPAKISPGQWSKRSTPEPEPCPDCGGKCLGPGWALGSDDCQGYGQRVQRMEDARPYDALEPRDFPGYYACDVEFKQLEAFEAGVAEWWRVVPPEPGDDPDEWHFAD